MLEDLIIAAVNEAISRANELGQDLYEQGLEKITKGLNLPLDKLF